MPWRENIRIVYLFSSHCSKITRYPFDFPKFSRKATMRPLNIFRCPKPENWSMAGVSHRPFKQKSRSHASSDSFGAAKRFNARKSFSISGCRKISISHLDPAHFGVFIAIIGKIIINNIIRLRGDPGSFAVTGHFHLGTGEFFPFAGDFLQH